MGRGHLSFESARKMGLIASLIVVIVPVVVVIFDVVSLLSLFGVVFSPGVAGRSPLSPFILGGLNYTLIALSAVGLAGVALFFVAMNTLSHYYSESGIRMHYMVSS